MFHADLHVMEMKSIVISHLRIWQSNENFLFCQIYYKLLNFVLKRINTNPLTCIPFLMKLPWQLQTVDKQGNLLENAKY